MRIRKGAVLTGAVRSSEDQLVDLTVYALSQARHNRLPIDDFGKTKIMKVIYDVADKLELPITRSWYMYGTYVWSDLASESRMNEFQTLSESDPRIKDTIALSRADEKGRFSQIKELVEQHELILDKPLSDFLDELYDRSPPRYKRVYKTHKKVLWKFRYISELREDAIPEPQFLNGSSYITAFQKELMVFDDVPDVVDLVLDYTTLMEDLMVRFDGLIEEPTAMRQFIPFFKDTYDTYRRTIWSFPPSIIARETMEGDNKEMEKTNRERHLTRVKRYLDGISERREKAFLGGYYPTESEISTSQNKLAQFLGNDEESLKVYFAKAIEISNREQR